MILAFANEATAQDILVPQLSYLGVGSQCLANITCLTVKPVDSDKQKRLVFLSPLFTRVEVLKVCRQGNIKGDCTNWPISFDCSQWPELPEGDYKVNLRNVLMSAFRNWISVSYVNPDR